MVRRDSHVLLDATVRRHKQGWQKLYSLGKQARESVQTEITTGDGGRSMRLDRDAAANELLEVYLAQRPWLSAGSPGSVRAHWPW